MTTVRQDPGTTPAGTAICGHCGQTLSGASTGRPRLWCSEACRKALKRAHTASQGTGSGGQAVPRGPEAGARQAAGFAAGRQAAPITAKPNTTSPQVSEFPDTADLTNPQVRASDDAGSSWYYAKFASPAGQTRFSRPLDSGVSESRRTVRYKLRQLLRQVSETDRCRRCGLDMIGSAVMVKVRDGVAHFAGVETCGRIWLCAVCAAKIRARRGDEIAEGVGRWIAQGGSAYFVTATLPHDQGDALKDSLNVLTKSWRFLTAGKGYQTEKERFGIVGNIKAVEITHGRNGWHPHIHAVILTKTDVGVLDLCDWFGRLDARWARALVTNKWSPGSNGIRLRLDLVTRSTAQGLAAYVTKVQENGLGNEIARADLKAGRKSSRTPLQILANFGTDGLVDDLDLWLEYERATAGKSALRWSRGLRDLLIPEKEEQTDEEIAAEDIGGDEVAALLPHTWRRLLAIPGAESAVLDAVEAGGWTALVRTLVAYRIDLDGLMTPQEWLSHKPV